ncbi:MAG: V0D/AC39 family V-type ATPase subunit [Nitrososphaera sp.]
MTSKVSMPSKIFGTVLSHGLRGRMLTKSEIQTLAESRDIDELVTRMRNTVYLDALAKLTKPYNAEKLEGALREYLVNMHAKMVTIAGGSTILDAYFVKYITMNLKLVLKGKALGKTYEELLPKINLRAEELVGRRDLVVKALVAKDLDEAAASLAGSEFGEDAAKSVAAYKEKRDVRLFDTFFDHAFYHALDRALATDSQSQDVKKLVSTDIDSYNVLAVLRGKFWGLSQQDITDLIVTTTPKVTRESLQKMINTEKLSEAIGELNNTVYHDIVPQNAANDIDAIMQLEGGFESVAHKRVISSFRAVFTVAIMLSALKLMMIEIKNLAAIAAGVEQKVPAETIMSRLTKLI